ncbi:MAG: SxtJ family membrane protein [Desulfobacca sp.]|uniref:SxtJ family membrane protein n=1 Tax=Desulfobacca sp. TaxID=2067990 RepID=UPI004049CD3F
MLEKPSPLKTYETMAVLTLVSLLAGLWCGQPLLLYLAAVLLFLVLFVKKLAVWLAWGWLRLAQFLGNVNAKVILTLIFYLILTPLALLYRLWRGDPLRVRQRQPHSNWHRRDHTYQREDLEKAW